MNNLGINEKLILKRKIKNC